MPMVLELTNTERYKHILSLKLIHTQGTLNLFPRQIQPEMLEGIALDDNLCLISGRGPFQGKDRNLRIYAESSQKSDGTFRKYDKCGLKLFKPI